MNVENIKKNLFRTKKLKDFFFFFHCETKETQVKVFESYKLIKYILHIEYMHMYVERFGENGNALRCKSDHNLRIEILTLALHLSQDLCP